MRIGTIVAQAALDASTLFYITLLLIFVTAIITTVVTKWSRDKCLKFFRGFRVTLERSRGQTLWGRLKVFSAGLEVFYDHAYVDPAGRKKTSYMFYQPEVETQILSILRYHPHLSAAAQRLRLGQVSRTFHPRLLRRMWRGVRNFINTLRDAFNAAIGAVVTQYQRTSPGGAALGSQTGAVTNIGTTLLGKLANAYEPLLEQYIGKPVILEVADPVNPNNAVREYTGYLADYTQQFIAVFNVEHNHGDEVTLRLPDVDRGDVLPPLPPPPPPGGAAPVLPPPHSVEAGVSIRVDGPRLKIHNTRGEILAVERLERPGFEPLAMSMILPAGAFLSLPARDARGGQLICRVVHSVDVVAPRKYATIRHAGELLGKRGLAQELDLDRLPLVSRLFVDSDGK